jgi:hypothetical protein
MSMKKNCETNPITAQESWRNWHGETLAMRLERGAAPGRAASQAKR